MIKTLRREDTAALFAGRPVARWVHVRGVAERKLQMLHRGTRLDDLRVPAPRINDTARQRRAVTADTAMRLARYFGTSAEFWMGLQADYEMARAREWLAAELAAITPRQAASAR